jgi:HAMP domain-containing protein
VGLVELLLPLLDGLAVVHAGGFLHRDIKPDNIQVRDDGTLVLLDFGSAGQTVAAVDPGAVVVTPGYAPIEQYGLGEQGPWTDLYALSATLYWAVAGKKPPDVESRMADPQSFVPAAEVGRGRFGTAFLEAIDWGLKINPEERPSDVAQFRRAICADHLASVNLQDALRVGDTVIEGEEHLPIHVRLITRVRRFLQTLVHPTQWPLAAKMALAMLCTALLPMLVVGAYNLRVSQMAIASGESRYVEQLAASTAGRVSQFITDNRHLARSLGSDADFPAVLLRPDAAAQGPAVLGDKLGRIVQANPDIQRITLVDAAGHAIASSEADMTGRSYAGEHYFQEALQGRSTTTSLILGNLGSAASMVLAEPVSAADGKVLGALVLRIRGSSIAAIVDEVRNDSALTPFLIDRDGVILHHLQEELIYRSLLPLPGSVQAALRADQRFHRDQVESLGETELGRAMVGAQGTGHVAYRSVVNQREEIAGFAPVAAHQWVVGVSESRTDFEAPLTRLVQQLLWSGAIVGLLFTVLALHFARGIVRPVRALTNAADALKAGDYDAASVKVERRDELGQLARTFNVMIDVLRQRERERDRKL